MRKHIVLTAALVALLGVVGCSGQEASSSGNDGQATVVSAENAPGQDDSIKIDEIDWEVGEKIIDGSRRLALSYTNNSPYTILQLRIEFTQREDVTDEERSVFDEAYADSGYVPSVSPDELYIVGENYFFVEPGNSADPESCSLAHATTNPTADQYALMEPSIATIRYLGTDGKVYLEYYDFINDSYSLDGDQTLDTITSDSWPDSELAKLVPTIDSTAVVVMDDSEGSFYIRAYGASEEDYGPYVEKCVEAGFTDVSFEGELYYHASNDDGFEIDVTYYELGSYLSISVSAPMS